MRSISRTFRHPLATETAVDSRLTFSFAKKNKRKTKTTFTGSAAKEKLKETLTSASHCASTLKQKTHIPTHTHRHTYILCFIKQQNCFNLQYSGEHPAHTSKYPALYSKALSRQYNSDADFIIQSAIFATASWFRNRVFFLHFPFCSSLFPSVCFYTLCSLNGLHSSQ